MTFCSAFYKVNPFSGRLWEVEREREKDVGGRDKGEGKRGASSNMGGDRGEVQSQEFGSQCVVREGELEVTIRKS